MKRWICAAVLGLAGFAQSQSIAALWDKSPHWWLQLLSLAILTGALTYEQSWRRAFLGGWIFATAWLCGTFWWLFISLHMYGGLATPLAVMAVLGLAAFLATYYAAACAVFVAVRLDRPDRPVRIDAMLWSVFGPLVFGALWLIAELARAILWTGFPWGASGYAFVDSWAGLLAPLVGVYGLSFLAAVFASLIGSAAVKKQWVAMTAAVICCCALALIPQRSANELAPVSETKNSISVTLLQGNIPQDEKFEAGTGVPQALSWYSEQLLLAHTDLVVTPETAIPLLPQQLPADYLKPIIQKYASGDSAALVGMPLGSEKQGYSNALIGIKPNAETYVLRKHHLVPFGEFIPPFFRWFTDLLQIPLGDFVRGDVAPPSFEWKGQRIAPNICYEDLFGEELAARFRDEAAAPTMFVNVSNIGWFGDSIAIDQHLLIARMRSIEFHRPTIRATNTGATVVIDASGRVTHALPPVSRGVLVADVHGASGMTFFAWWASRFGVWPLFLLALAIVAGPAAMRIRRS